MPSRVTSVTSLPGKHRVYDLSVENKHTFFANGIAVHNCDTTGVEPDFALVKFKKLAGGGYFKIVNQSVPAALSGLGYNAEEVDEIVAYVIGRGTLEGAPEIDHGVLKTHGMTDEDIAKIEAVLPSSFDLAGALNGWTLGAEAMTRLGIEESAWQRPDFNLLRHLGFTRPQIDAAETFACGTQTIEGAPHLKEEHYPVFDTANRCGKKGTRYIQPHGHLRMMAAAQPFLSGAISKTINMPNEATVEEIGEAYETGWQLGLKAVALYRDGSKLSQPLSTKSDKEEEKEDEAKAEAAGADIHSMVTMDSDMEFAETIDQSLLDDDGELSLEDAETLKMQEDEILELVAEAAGFGEEIKARRQRMTEETELLPPSVLGSEDETKAHEANTVDSDKVASATNGTEAAEEGVGDLDNKIAKLQSRVRRALRDQTKRLRARDYAKRAARKSGEDARPITVVSDLAPEAPAAKETAAPAEFRPEDISQDQLLKIVRQRLASDNDANLEFKRLLAMEVGRRRLPSRRGGFTQKAKVAGHTIFVRTGEYEDASLGEIFIDMHKEGAAFRSLLNSFAIAVSIGLQYGVPLEEYVDKFIFSRFEPAGMVDHPNIKRCTSVIDYIFRLLAMEYLGRTDIVQVPPKPEEAPSGRGAAVADDEDAEIGEAHVAKKVATPAKAKSEAVAEGATAKRSDKKSDEKEGEVAPLAASRRPIGFNVGALSKEGKEAVEGDLPGLIPAEGVPANPERNQASAAPAAAPTSKSGEAKNAIESAPAGDAVDAAQRAAEQKALASMMGDAPPCSECGSLMRRNGACYVCPNCGSGGGCG